MGHDAALQVTIQRLSRLIRQRRALFYGLRGLAFGLVLAVVPVLLRSILGSVTLPIAAGAIGAGLLAGIAYGLLLRVPAADVARLADRTYALHDRLATALELSRSRDPNPLAASV